MPIKDFFDILLERHCCRGFLPEAVDRAVVDECIAAANRAPSSKNGQPWALHLADGAALERLREDLLTAFDEGIAAAPEYRYSPAELPEAQMARARACGFGLFAHKGIGRDDKPARRLHDRENNRLFGAPAFAVLTLPRTQEKGTFLDGGLFLGSFLLALRAAGLESTPMYSVACFPSVLRRHLDIAEDRMVVCGVAFGKEDPSNRVNAFRTDREPVEGVRTWTP